MCHKSPKRQAQRRRANFDLLGGLQLPPPSQGWSALHLAVGSGVPPAAQAEMGDIMQLSFDLFGVNCQALIDKHDQPGNKPEEHFFSCPKGSHLQYSTKPRVHFAVGECKPPLVICSWAQLPNQRSESFLLIPTILLLLLLSDNFFLKILPTPKWAHITTRCSVDPRPSAIGSSGGSSFKERLPVEMRAKELGGTADRQSQTSDNRGHTGGFP